MSVFPRTHEYYRRSQGTEYGFVWQSVCDQLSVSCVGLMRHCPHPGGRLPCMSRDTGGWINLSHAAGVIKEHFRWRKEFIAKTSHRVKMPLTKILTSLNYTEIEWLLAAFGCVNYDQNKHRVQLFIERGINCNRETESTAGGDVNPNLRVIAIRFCCGHSEDNQPFLDTARFGAEITRQMLLYIPSFFHYTDKLAAEIILRDGLKPGTQLTRGGRTDVHSTLFCPQDRRGDGCHRITKNLDFGNSAAVICLSAKNVETTGRINPSDGICLWGYVPPTMIDAILLVWRTGDRGSWDHKIIYDSSLPAAERYVDEPGKRVASYTVTDLQIRTSLDATNPEDHDRIMRVPLTAEKDGWQVEMTRCPACYKGTPQGST